MNKPQNTIHEVKPNTFIFEKQNALPLDICQEMIRRFEQDTENQYQGRIGQTLSEEQSIKRSTDLVTSGKENWQDLDKELFRSLGKAIHTHSSKAHSKTTVTRYNVPTPMSFTTGTSMAAATNLLNDN